jgi:hypothetical protein
VRIGIKVKTSILSPFGIGCTMSMEASTSDCCCETPMQCSPEKFYLCRSHGFLQTVNIRAHKFVY